ncbi:hypothetical protein SEA_PSONYX_87 [Corynebacterium phage PSonyx]|nr:hypothetical protein SEA_PSONYX_87 [Corynebacterium phage PSonyx]
MAKHRAADNPNNPTVEDLHNKYKKEEDQ